MDAILAGMAWKGTVVLALAWLMAWLLRRRSAAARHLVWTAAAAAVIALPILSMGLPALHVPAAVVDSNVVFRVFATAATTTGAPAVINTTDGAGRKPAPLGRRLPAAGTVVVVVWAAGAALAMLQVLVAYGAMWRKKRRAPPFDDGGQEIPVLQAEAGSMPMTFGLLRPAVFLPADARDWPEERRRMVLLHELAHARRGDVATHLLARTALSLYWWNPLAWIAWREFLKERERAADDLVLHAGARASEYAAHLLEVARSMQSARSAGAVAVAMARPSQLEGRLLAILDSGRRRGSATGLAVFTAVVAAVAFVAPFAAVRAQTTPVPPEIDATIRAALSQKNHEILDRAAKAYEEIQNFDMAKTLLEAALPIRGEVAGEQSAVYAAGLVKLGDLAVKRRQPAEAYAFYSKAVSLGDRPEVAPALLYLGLKAFREREPDAAFELFQRAYDSDSNGKPAGLALRWMAIIRARQPERVAEADVLFQRAIALEEPDSLEAATTQELYAMYLRQMDRGAEADPIETRALQIRNRHARGLSDAANISVGPRFLARGVGGGTGSDLSAGPGAGPGSSAVSSRVSGPGSLDSNGVYRVGGGVSAPRLIHKLEPEYSEEARAAKYQGSVLLSVDVGTDGLAHKIRVARSVGLGLDEKAVEAVRLWRFKPGEKDGVPVTVAATIEVNFRLM